MDLMKKQIREYDLKQKKKEDKKTITLPITDLQKLIQQKPGETIQSDQVFCGECGTKLPMGNTFCPGCGTAIEGAIKTAIVQAQPTTQFTTDEKKQTAFQIYKDSKNTSIICMMAICFPLFCSLIAVVNVMAAVIVALFGVLYPCLIFVKHMNLQGNFYKKYGWKPLLMFQQQQQSPPQAQPGSKPNKRGDFF